jgi:heptosyltransferase III
MAMNNFFKRTKSSVIFRKTIFVFRIGNLGDSLVALPSVRKIQQLNPDAKIVLITEQAPNSYVSTWSVFKLTGVFHDVVFYKKELLDIIRVIGSIRKEKNPSLYYLAPHRSIEAVRRDKFFFEKICGIKEIKGFDFLVEPEAIKNSAGKMMRQEKESLQLLKSINDGVTSELPPRPYIQPSKKDFAKVYSLVPNFSNSVFRIALTPGSKMLSKKWPIQRYSDFVNRVLQSDFAVEIIIFGAVEEEYEANFILTNSLSKRVISLVGKTSIGESAAALTLCSVYVGNDTGTMHLASSMGLPCLGIFASRANPGRWEPFGNENTILRKELPCSGCNLETCANHANKCLTEITVDNVFQAFSDIKNR